MCTVALERREGSRGCPEATVQVVDGGHPSGPTDYQTALGATSIGSDQIQNVLSASMRMIRPSSTS